MISVCSRIDLNDRLSVEAADILDFQRHFYATVFIFGMYIGILKLGVGKTEAKRERSLFTLLVEQCIAVVVAVVDNPCFFSGEQKLRIIIFILGNCKRQMAARNRLACQHIRKRVSALHSAVERMKYSGRFVFPFFNDIRTSSDDINDCVLTICADAVNKLHLV